MYSLNYRFFAAVQNTSLTNKLSATDAKRPNPIRCKTQKTPHAPKLHTRSPKKKKRETENDTKLFQTTSSITTSEEKRKEIRDISPKHTNHIFGNTSNPYY